jgi:hypothetical protein
MYRECLSVREKCLSSTHPDLLDVLAVIGDISFKQGQYEESLQLFVLIS